MSPLPSDVILSEAKNLYSALGEILRYAQDDNGAATTRTRP
jgi:hypothetical protein